eukprot:TRINITY_DN9583_c0_g1_i15.p1 TRINITY_DN9583_c0_g1~~TRINITY_DN9583_c0_g1_i15.p1  ORF type:complete len:589 (-),score=160.73 TRINITY_DN9583_c0_g1_i15:186-1952(-)
MEELKRPKVEFGMPYYKDNNTLKSILYSEIDMANEKFSAADVCFICDITGSMSTHIEVVRSILIDFVNNVRSIINTQPRISFIGFRDKKDKNQIEFKNFTTNPHEMVEYLKGITCTGGDDECEDLITPLKKALTLDWKSDLIYVYLLIDSPSHGTRYHDGKAGDSHPGDDKDRMIEKLSYHLTKSKINLVVLKCNNSVDTMIKIMREYYDTELNKLNVIEITHRDVMKANFAKNFLITPSKDFGNSFANSQFRNFKRIRHKAFEAETYESELELDFARTFIGVVYTGSITNLSYETQKYKYKLSLIKSVEFNCSISNTRIGVGTFAQCFPLVIDGDKDYVAKISRETPKDFDELSLDIEASLFAKYFADKFTHYLKQVDMRDGAAASNSFRLSSFKVLPLVIIESIKAKKGSKMKYFLAQKLLSGEYKKYNNNYGWKLPEESLGNLLAQAFSHFTYEYSMGTMIVVDIQGIESRSGELTITDPAVHSILYKGRFGNTNHGKIGIMRFFKTHKCNNFCKKLFLSDPAKVDKALDAKMRKKFEKEKGLNHLYEECEKEIEARRKRIKSFDPRSEPKLASIEEEFDAEDDI